MNKIIIIFLISFIFSENLDISTSKEEGNDAWKMNMLMLGGGLLPMGQLENNKPYKAISIFGLNYYWLNEFKEAKKNNDISDRNRSFWWMFLLTTYSIIDAYVDSHMKDIPLEKNINK